MLLSAPVPPKILTDLLLRLNAVTVAIDACRSPLESVSSLSVMR
jgi:hypothetical protein